MENRHELAVAGLLSKATGTAERRASEAMLAIRRRLAGRRITAGEDKAYDTTDHVARLRAAEDHAARDAEQRADQDRQETAAARHRRTHDPTYQFMRNRKHAAR